MCVWRSIFISKWWRRRAAASYDIAARCPCLKRFDRLGLRDFGAAILTGAAPIIIPEIEHCLAEVLDDIAAIEIDVFDEGAAFFAIKDHVLVFAGRAAAFYDDADCVRGANRRVDHIGRNEEGLTLADEMIDGF